MIIKLTSIMQLHEKMRANEINRYKFEFKCAKAIFDVFYFIDKEPYILLFGAKGTTFSFIVEVSQEYLIETELDNDVYNKLCDILGLKSDPIKKFSPYLFFDYFNDHIPNGFNMKNETKPQDIAVYSNVHKKDKIYFYGWRNNDLRGDTVSKENLEKTRSLLGEEIYMICKKQNISSCWSSHVTKAGDLSSIKIRLHKHIDNN